MTTGPDAPATGFHRAAATVLRDASSPDDVVGAPEMCVDARVP